MTALFLAAILALGIVTHRQAPPTLAASAASTASNRAGHPRDDPHAVRMPTADPRASLGE